MSSSVFIISSCIMFKTVSPTPWVIIFVSTPCRPFQKILHDPSHRSSSALRPCATRANSLTKALIISPKQLPKSNLDRTFLIC
ncbi:hypothetical protein F5Y13DRAFT_7722 [Hypoxylon sp. FL1857]|nr:hypothetical protein F5Y13DRAFT_7722 [Hypoxylon sp. FL1857]